MYVCMYACMYICLGLECKLDASRSVVVHLILDRCGDAPGPGAMGRNRLAGLGLFAPPGCNLQRLSSRLNPSDQTPARSTQSRG
jgi:hypothetical protein